MTDLADRVALLTGASGGIGKAIGKRLAEEGVDVCLAYGHHREDAEEVAAYARGVGRRAVTVASDMADPQGPADLVA
ncbi:MAG: 3-oxoacyl-[acyl-carrier protein] reductase, partial [Mycobacterium sp.]|nr:3-oxoacyl-[acyl-carrier protein] reductase [Mycobacterium sp.]